MSRGLGKVQRSILALIEARPGEAFVVRDLVQAIDGSAKPTRPQIDAIVRALKMRLPGEWRSGYVQGGGGRRWLYRDVAHIARRMWKLETFEVVQPVEQPVVQTTKPPVLVQATNGVWFELAELEPITTTIILLSDLDEACVRLPNVDRPEPVD
jgi:hypothetical protein